MALAVLPRIRQPRFGLLVMFPALGLFLSVPVVPGHRAPRPAAWRSVYRAGILELFHRPAVINAGSSTPLFTRSWAMPTRPLCPV